LSLEEKHSVLRHDHFEEICAAASIGQATPEELHELEQHAAQCEACRRAYFHYLDYAAQSFAAADLAPTLTPQEAQQCLNSELFTRRFYQRAEREGIVFSPDVDEKPQEVFTPLLPFPRRFNWMNPAWGFAAVVMVVLMISTWYAFRSSSIHPVPAAMPEQARITPMPNSPVVKPDPAVAELTAASVKLQAEIDHISADLRKSNSRLNSTEKELTVTLIDRRELEADRAALVAQLNNIHRQLAEAQAVAANTQQEIAMLRERESDKDATLVASQFKIQELTQGLKDRTTAWDQERQLLTLGRDVTDLMAARNLHIVDVVDTDPRGKTRPSFGRIFFTEGKSLVFYAYDLNEAKVEKANYEYRIWARKEGPDRQVRNLGIFYSDNNEQRRWVFKCNDPKILNEIDSVFVTLERSNSDPAHPQGPDLMYAYLRGQPNHP
jgi:hypothetical protein